MSPERVSVGEDGEGHSTLMDRKQKRRGNQQWRVWCEESGGWEYFLRDLLSCGIMTTNEFLQFTPGSVTLTGFKSYRSLKMCSLYFPGWNMNIGSCFLSVAAVHHYETVARRGEWGGSYFFSAYVGSFASADIKNLGGMLDKMIWRFSQSCETDLLLWEVLDNSSYVSCENLCLFLTGFSLCIGVCCTWERSVVSLQVHSFWEVGSQTISGVHLMKESYYFVHAASMLFFFFFLY